MKYHSSSSGKLLRYHWNLISFLRLRKSQRLNLKALRNKEQHLCIHDLPQGRVSPIQPQQDGQDDIRRILDVRKAIIQNFKYEAQLIQPNQGSFRVH